MRCCIYRQFDDLVNERRMAEQQMEAVATTLLATLNEAGVTARRANGKDFYEWMLPFFNRNVPWASTGAVTSLGTGASSGVMGDAAGARAASATSWALVSRLRNTAS